MNKWIFLHFFNQVIFSKYIGCFISVLLFLPLLPEVILVNLSCVKHSGKIFAVGKRSGIQFPRAPAIQSPSINK